MAESWADLGFLRGHNQSGLEDGTLMDVGRQLMEKSDAGHYLWSGMEWQSSRQQMLRNCGLATNFLGESTSMLDTIRTNAAAGTRSQMREFTDYPVEETHQNVDPNVEMAKQAMVGNSADSPYLCKVDFEWELDQRRVEQRGAAWRNSGDPPQVLDFGHQLNRRGTGNNAYGSPVFEGGSVIDFQLQDFHHPGFGFPDLPPFSSTERVASNDGTGEPMDCLVGDLHAEVPPDAMSPCFKSDTCSPPHPHNFDLLPSVSPSPESNARFCWQPEFVMCEDLGRNVSSSLSSPTSFFLSPAASEVVSLSEEAHHLLSTHDFRREDMPGPHKLSQQTLSLRPVRSTTPTAEYPFPGTQRMDHNLVVETELQEVSEAKAWSEDEGVEVPRTGIIQGGGGQNGENESQAQVQTLRTWVIKCFEAMEARNDSAAQALLKNLRELSSPDGDFIRRVASCFCNAFSQRLGELRPMKEEPEDWPWTDLLEARALTEACPYSKFVHLSANQALLEAIEGADVVHIIDFGIMQGVQWSALLQALATEPGRSKPPTIRITGIASPKLGHNPSASLQATGRRLSEFAKLLGLKLRFCPLTVELKDLEPKMFQLLDGECVAINFMLQLHQHAGDAELLDRTLKLVRSLQPKVVVLVEYESAVSKTDSQTRLLDSLEHYFAFFESLEVAMPRDCPERANIERVTLAEEIKALFGWGSTEGKVRHETFERWRSLMSDSGFKALAPSHYSISQARLLLWLYSDKFKLMPNPGSLSLGWRDRRLITVSAWKCG